MSFVRMIGVFGLGVMLTGCMGASTNPRDGGLFGYSPEAYEQRQQERQNRLAALEAEQRRESGQTAGLESQRAAKAQTVSRQQQEVQVVEQQAAAASRKLETARVGNAEQERRLAELKRRAAGLEQSTSKAAAGPDTAARKAELDRLRKEYKELQRDIDALLQ